VKQVGVRDAAGLQYVLQLHLYALLTKHAGPEWCPLGVRMHGRCRSERPHR
jgi:hypothetical protein